MAVFYEDRKTEISSALRTLAEAHPVRVRTYTEFGALFDPPIPPRGPWKGILDMIAREEVADGRPDITFLVVSKKTGYPGQIGFQDARPPSPAQKRQPREEFDRIVAFYGRGRSSPNPF
jgi:hypothetical protein